jgi:hypothetical protein
LEAHYWQFRAEEARAISSEAGNAGWRCIMDEIAASYQGMVDLSAEFEAVPKNAIRVPSKGFRESMDCIPH